LAAAGYRATREQHHYRVIQSLRETIGADVALVNALDAFRKRRNIAGYDRVGSVSAAEADEMRGLAVRLREDVRMWLRKKHPGLVRAR
jgi:hypothetical protein